MFQTARCRRYFCAMDFFDLIACHLREPVSPDDCAPLNYGGEVAPLDVVPLLDDVSAAVARIARRGDVVITLGAGSIGTVPDRLIARLEEKRP